MEVLKRKLADDEEGLRALLELAKTLKPEDPSPFNVTPHEIVRLPKQAWKKFGLKYGLIQIIFNDMPAYDPFQHRTMDKHALSAVHACFGKQGCWNATAAYDDPKQEDRCGGVHAVMILGFRSFTRSRGNGKGKFDMRVGMCDDQEEDYSNYSLLVEDQSAGTKAKEKADRKLLVFNPKYVTSASPDSAVPANPEGAVLSVVSDRKTNVVVEHILQSGSYGVNTLLESTQDREKEFRPPVLLEVWDADKWYYGILEVDYFVSTEDGSITQASLNKFPAEKTSPIGRKFTSAFTRDEVKELFNKWEAGLRGVQIPDSFHPVGRLYVRKKHFNLPQYAKESASLTVGAKRFYEGNLKHLVGKKVRSWTDVDVMKAFHSRDEEQKQVHDESEAREWVKEVLFPKVDIDAIAAKYNVAASGSVSAASPEPAP